jgi:GNAT superfamily N-acetyltransferase
LQDRNEGFPLVGPGYHLTPIQGVDPGLARLNEEAIRDGYRFVARLANDWVSGSNRFDQPGEYLAGAIREGRLLGCCGLNRDPYTKDPGVGRLRHLYVMKSERNQGIGSALVRYLLEEARSAFVVVRLRTDTPEAARFYERVGFAGVREEHASHEIRL